MQIDSNIGCGDIFVLGQLFVFGGIVLHAYLTGHLGCADNFAPNQVLMFGSLEYTADTQGDLVLSGWISDQFEDPSGGSLGAGLR